MTENVSSRYADFDQWSAEEAVEAMYEGQLMALAAIRPALGVVAAAAEAAAARLGEEGRLIYAGAGTSGRLAVQDGAELAPTFSWPRERMVFCVAGGMQALTVSIEGAEDSAEDGIEEITSADVGPHDVLIAVAASGRTPYTLGALREAKRRGALTIGIAMNGGTPVLKEADHPLLAETGSELIAGSTRMKAGTAQKVILNMISTAIMTRMGRIYKGYMVDMKVSNQKLEKRAVAMVSDIAGCTQAEARTALGAADLHIKTAVLVALGEDVSTAKELLAASSDNLRAAFDLRTRRGGA